MCIHSAWNIRSSIWIFIDIYLLCFAISLFLYRKDSFFTSSFHSLSHSSVSIVGGFIEPVGFNTETLLKGILLCFKHFFSIDFFSSWYCSYFSLFSPIIRSIFYFVFVMIDSNTSSFDFSGLLSYRPNMIENLACKLRVKGIF